MFSIFFKSSFIRIARWDWLRCGTCGVTALFVITLVLGNEMARAQNSCAHDPTLGGCELVIPLICSRDPAASTAPLEICELMALPGPGDHKSVQVNLTAVTSSIKVGGYSVKTENFNGSYLSPVLEAMVGDTVAARLENDSSLVRLRMLIPGVMARTRSKSDQPALFPRRYRHTKECQARERSS